MSDKAKLVEMGQKYSMKTFNRGDKILVSGQGSYVKDIDGKTYLDFLSGIAVNSLGHSHPQLVQALHEQSQQLMHGSNLFWYEESIKASKRLVDASCLNKIFFSNSGAEANEGAIKLARKYGEESKGKGATQIISMTQSFHGRTLATLKATGQEAFHQDFGPHIPGFTYVDFNDSQGLEEAVGDQTCAILLEVVQGEGGVNLISPDFVETIQALKSQYGFLVIIDEIQTGIGRTGSFYAYEQVGLEPDIMTLAKGIAGGFPTGAFLAKEEVASHLSVGDHGTTFGGNPMATACINTVLDVFEEENILDNVQARSQQLRQGLASLKETYPKIQEIKGLGLLVGLELSADWDVSQIIDQCYQEGLIVTSAKGNVLRLLPSLNVKKEEIEEGLDILEKVFASQA